MKSFHRFKAEFDDENLIGVSGLLAGVDGNSAGQLAFIDIDDTIKATYGYSKQAVSYGYSGVKGLNAQIAAVSTPDSAPVVFHLHSN